MPKPSHSVRIGASAKTGIAWLTTSAGDSARPSRGTVAMAAAVTMPSAAPSPSPSSVSQAVSIAAGASSARWTHSALPTARGPGSR